MKEVSVSLWEIDKDELKKIAKEQPCVKVLLYNRITERKNILCAEEASKLKSSYIYLEDYD